MFKIHGLTRGCIAFDSGDEGYNTLWLIKVGTVPAVKEKLANDSGSFLIQVPGVMLHGQQRPTAGVRWLNMRGAGSAKEMYALGESFNFSGYPDFTNEKEYFRQNDGEFSPAWAEKLEYVDWDISAAGDVQTSSRAVKAKKKTRANARKRTSTRKKS